MTSYNSNDRSKNITKKTKQNKTKNFHININSSNDNSDKSNNILMTIITKIVIRIRE